MRVGIDASRAQSDEPTGTESYSLALIRHMLALPAAVRHSWRLYLQRPDRAGRLPAESGHTAGAVTHCVLPAQRFWTHRALRRAIVRNPPDVLFVPAHVVPLAPPHLLPPTVVTVHDLGHRHAPAAHTLAQRLYLELSTRWSSRVARRVVAVSQSTASDLTRFYGVDPGKIRVIHEAPAPRLPFVAPGTASAAEPPGGSARPYALYLGTIQPRKNLERLIRAYAQLVQREELEWDLVLAGKKGWLSRDLYAVAYRLGIGHRVYFPGYIPAESVDMLLSNARFFAFPSLFEGFGLPVLEAQQIGVPVMCANNSSLPEVAGDGALLVDPTDIDAIADAMLRLSRDEELRQRLIVAGYENVKRFSWEKAARETLAVLEEAAGLPAMGDNAEAERGDG